MPPEAAVTTPSAYAFEDRYDFTDDLLGKVQVNQLERDCIDTPEYRRLFRLAQLGLVDRLYQTANHTRGIHSIGVCIRAKQLVDTLNQNTPAITKARNQRNRTKEQEHCHSPASTTLPRIGHAERCLISLAGLLHDLPHAPFSHDLEKKTHRFVRADGKSKKISSFYGPYPKHDDYANNPALYIIFFDPKKSVLARVLQGHSGGFWTLLQEEAVHNLHVGKFVSEIEKSDWFRQDREAFRKTVLPALLFHLFVFDNMDDALKSPTAFIATDFDGKDKVRKEHWGLGSTDDDHQKLHGAWYQPYRHDIVGNTLCADLLDYLARDAQRLGMRNAFDKTLLKYYVLVEVSAHQHAAAVPGHASTEEPRTVMRCAIDLNDYKRGVIRAERINDIFRLLDFRHQIHEKAIAHRIVQSAIAMLSRALLLLGDEKPTLEEVYMIGKHNHAIAGDDSFLARLADPNHSSPRTSHSIGQKIAERRLYRPLMILPGDEVCQRLQQTSPDETLRHLGAILDSRYFAPFLCFVCWCAERLLDHSFASLDELHRFIGNQVIDGPNLQWAKSIVPARVILWVTPYKQLYKDPAIVVRVGDQIARLDQLATNTTSMLSEDGKELPGAFRRRLLAGLQDSETRYDAMWRICVFISDGLYYSGGLARLLPDHPCIGNGQKHCEHLRQAQEEIGRAMRVAWQWANEDPGIDLDHEMPDDGFRRLLGFYMTYPRRREIDGGGVDLAQYTHAEPTGNCADIRYRYDRAGELETVMQESDVPKENRTDIRTLLQHLNVDFRGLKHEEVADIVFHLNLCIGGISADLTSLAAQKAAHSGLGHVSEKMLRSHWVAAEAGLGFEMPKGEHGVFGRDAGVSDTTQGAQYPRLARADSGDGEDTTAKSGLFDATDSAREGRRAVSDSPKARRRK